jgi:three-Cys-motif partner protein
MKEKIYREGYDFFFWPYEPQTKIKHFVFQEYFDKWVKIVGRWNELNYFDCYAGSGAYIEDENIYYGSPVLAAEIVEKNKEHLGRKVNIVIIEHDKANIENIKKIFQYKKLQTEPIIIEGDFDKTVNDVLDEVQDNLKPTFFFIDPFGFKIRYETLQRIMSIPKSEILLNFMFTQINRFLIDPLGATLNELFGCEDWKRLRTITGAEREQKIVNLYRMKLKEIASFVFPYRICFPDKERTYYYLFHLTKHYKGCSIMKSSFAKFNYGNIEFSGPKHKHLSFFELKDIKADEIKRFLLQKYKGLRKKYEEILTGNIDSVPFLESDIKDALKDMEGKEIKIKRIPELTRTGRKRKGVDLSDVISF